MKHLQTLLFIALLLATAIQETNGFVRVGRSEERKRDKSAFEDSPKSVFQRQQRRGRLQQRRVLKQLALAKVLSDTFENYGVEVYLVVAKKDKRGIRNVNNKMPNSW